MSDLVVRNLVGNFGLKVNTAGFAQGNAALEALSGKAKAVLGSIGVGIGAGALAASVKATVDSVADYTSRIAKTASLAGETAQSFQALEQGAKTAGAPVEAITEAASHLREQFAAMSGAHGVPNFHASLRNAGVAMTDSTGKMRPLSDILQQVEKRVLRFKDPMRQAVEATRYLGSAGEALLPAFRKGLGKAIGEANEDLDHFNARILDKDIGAIKTYKAELSRLDLMFMGLKMSVAGPFTAMFSDVLKGFNDWAGKGKGIDFKGIRAAMDQMALKLGPLLLASMKAIAGAFDWVARNAGIVSIGLASIAAVPLIGFLYGVAGAAAAALAPLILFAAPIAGMMLLAEDIALFLKYGDKADTIVGSIFPTIGAKIKDIKRLFDVGDWVNAFEKIGDAWAELLGKMLQKTIDFAEKTAERLNPFAKKKVGTDYVTSGRMKADQDTVANADFLDRAPGILGSKKVRDARARLEEGKGAIAEEAKSQALSPDEENRRKFSQQPIYQLLRSLGVSEGVAPLAEDFQRKQTVERFANQAGVAANQTFNITLTSPDPIIAAQMIKKVMEEREKEKAAELARQ